MVIDGNLVKSFAPQRSDEGHKGTHGMALIVAGSEYMTGAQTLAVSSCLRSGVGMVRVLGPESSYVSTRISCPCALFSPYSESVSRLLSDATKYLSKVSAVLIGPGIDTGDYRSMALLSMFIQKAPRLVIDAGALNLVAKFQEELLPLIRNRVASGLEPAILTPHIGEFRRLIGKERKSFVESELKEQAAAYAKTNNCIVVLKSYKTVIQTPDCESYVNIMSNSGMGKGGSGDVLAGLMTGFLAQGISPVACAISSVYIHGFAGAVAASEIGKRAMLPTDLIDNLSYAYESVGWK